jgi:hypothetical protein
MTKRWRKRERKGADDFKPGSLIRKVLAGPPKLMPTQLKSYLTHKGVKLISIIGLYIRFIHNKTFEMK